MKAMRYYVALGVIVVLFVIIGSLYASQTPPWQVPDEPAHYNYVAQIASEGCCPVIAPGDYNQEYLETLKAEQFPDDADLSPIEYEDHQPPVYYLLATPIYKLSKGGLLAMRLGSVAAGAGVVIAAYFAVARLCPAHKELALAAAAFVAFIPQHVAMMAGVNNDSVAELVLGITLVVTLTYLGNPLRKYSNDEIAPLEEAKRPHAAALGGLVGVAFLTKLTIYPAAVGVVALAIIWRWRREGRSFRWAAGQALWAGGMALGLGAIWWVRDIVVYGWPDVMGLNTHNAIVAGQPTTGELIGTIGFGPYLGAYLTTTFHSFWGQFGWMGVPLAPRTYLLIGIFSMWSLVGLVVLLGWFRDRLALAWHQRAGVWALLVTLLLTLLIYVRYNLWFVQFQGRYLFPALIPVGLTAAGGVWGWALLIERLVGEHHRTWLRWLPLAAMAWLPLLDLWALYKAIVPYLD